MSGSIPSALEDRGADDGRRSFADSPEARAKQPKRRELTPAETVALEQASRAVAAEEALADTYEAILDQAAYETPIENVDDPSYVADTLLGTGNSDRLRVFVEEWGSRDPAAAEGWAAEREALLGQAYAQRLNNEYVEAQAEQQAKASSELADVLVPEIEEAIVQAERERQIRAAFRQPTFADFKHGRDPQPLPELTWDDVLNKAKGKVVVTTEQARAMKEARVADFREQFKDASTSKFAKGYRDEG